MGLTGKEFHLNITRNQGHYKVKLKRVDAPTYKQPGVLHRLQAQKRRLEGDVPKISLTQKINNLQPKGAFGKGVKTNLKIVNGARKVVGGAAWKAALGAETVAISGKTVAVNHFRQEFRQNADTLDTGKAVLGASTALRTVNGARKTVVQHRLQKKQYKLLKNKVKSLKGAKKSAKRIYKVRKKRIKADKKATKAKLKAVHKNFGKKSR